MLIYRHGITLLADFVHFKGDVLLLKKLVVIRQFDLLMVARTI